MYDKYDDKNILSSTLCSVTSNEEYVTWEKTIKIMLHEKKQFISDYRKQTLQGDHCQDIHHE